MVVPQIGGFSFFVPVRQVICCRSSCSTYFYSVVRYWEGAERSTLFYWALFSISRAFGAAGQDNVAMAEFI